jgi:L-seryl-tRNA(Ser) seleniumtransferase
MFELQLAAGRHLARLSGAESGMVCDGSAACIASATAGCMAGTDSKNVWQLPDTTGLKGEVVITGGRSAFDSAIRLTGAKLVVARTIADVPAALNANTAMVYTTWRDDRLQQILKITKPAGVPVLLDDAAGIPPFENFTSYAKTGVDLFCFSGGKGLCGPQASGLLLGRKELITAALANSAPWEGSICRAMKVGKEEIMGVLAAVDYWSKADLNALNKEWAARVERIKKLIETVPGVTGTIAIPTGGNSYPTLTAHWDEKAFGLTVEQCDAALRAGSPRIEVLTNSNPSLVPATRSPPPANANRPATPRPNSLQIISMTLQTGEDLIVGNRLRQILNDARKKAGA